MKEDNKRIFIPARIRAHFVNLGVKSAITGAMSTVAGCRDGAPPVSKETLSLSVCMTVGSATLLRKTGFVPLAELRPLRTAVVVLPYFFPGIVSKQVS